MISTAPHRTLASQCAHAAVQSVNPLRRKGVLLHALDSVHSCIACYPGVVRDSESNCVRTPMGNAVKDLTPSIPLLLGGRSMRLLGGRLVRRRFDYGHRPTATLQDDLKLVAVFPSAEAFNRLIAYPKLDDGIGIAQKCAKSSSGWRLQESGVPSSKVSSPKSCLNGGSPEYGTVFVLFDLAYRRGSIFR